MSISILFALLSGNKLRPKEVKPLMFYAFAITVIGNRFLFSINKTDDFGFVELTGEDVYRAHHARQPLQWKPDFEVASINYDFTELPARAVKLLKHAPKSPRRK